MATVPSDESRHLSRDLVIGLSRRPNVYISLVFTYVRLIFLLHEAARSLPKSAVPAPQTDRIMKNTCVSTRFLVKRKL